MTSNSPLIIVCIITPKKIEKKNYKSKIIMIILTNCEKKLFLRSRKTFLKLLEQAIQTPNSEKSEQFLKQNAFLTYFYGSHRSNKSEYLEFK